MVEVKSESLKKEYSRIKKFSEFDLDYYEINKDFDNLVKFVAAGIANLFCPERSFFIHPAR